MLDSWETERNLAMLIDGDNAQYSMLSEMIEEASRSGTIIIRRAYGDWTQPNLAHWRSQMLKHAIQPIQQWRITGSKNATDSALIIDAMDILHAGAVQGFCIVSSDSDYTRLSTRIRESGLFVMGMGRKHTPEAFINACDVFIFIENLVPPEQSQKTQTMQYVNGGTPKENRKLLSLLHRAFEITESEDGWVHLGALGHSLRKIDPSFDSRTYGHKTLSLLVNSLPDLVINKTGTSTIHVRMKEAQV